MTDVGHVRFSAQILRYEGKERFFRDSHMSYSGYEIYRVFTLMHTPLFL